MTGLASLYGYYNPQRGLAVIFTLFCLAATGVAGYGLHERESLGITWMALGLVVANAFFSVIGLISCKIITSEPRYTEME